MLSNIFYSYGESLTAAFLPELARREALGRVSGWGWSFGYFGGMLTLGLSLAYVLWAQGQGIAATQFVPVTMLITAAIYGVASLLTFALLKERAVPQPTALRDSGLRASWKRLLQTWRHARSYQDFVWLLACAVAYQAGIAVVIALAAVYAEQVLGFKQTQTMMLIFLVNIAAALGAFAFGYWQDRIGHRPALAVTLIGWVVMTILAVLATSAALFWVAAVVAGLCMGSSQSAGRAMAGAFAPRRTLGRILRPMDLRGAPGRDHRADDLRCRDPDDRGNRRPAILSTGVFFIIGLLILAKVNVPRGVAAAAAAA